jgi:hypothetical protein
VVEEGAPVAQSAMVAQDVKPAGGRASRSAASAHGHVFEHALPPRTDGL